MAEDNKQEDEPPPEEEHKNTSTSTTQEEPTGATSASHSSIWCAVLVPFQGPRATSVASTGPGVSNKCEFDACPGLTSFVIIGSTTALDGSTLAICTTINQDDCDAETACKSDFLLGNFIKGTLGDTW